MAMSACTVGRREAVIEDSPLSIVKWCSSTPSVRTRARTMSSVEDEKRTQRTTCP